LFFVFPLPWPLDGAREGRVGGGSSLAFRWRVQGQCSVAF
jgi:hypothetical protein